LGHHWFFS